MPAHEKCFFEDPREFKKRLCIFRLKFDVRNQQVIDHRDPYLREYGILGSAEERLDLEMLLDPFEEELDLPAVFVDEGDIESGKLEVVGEV